MCVGMVGSGWGYVVKNNNTIITSAINNNKSVQCVWGWTGYYTIPHHTPLPHIILPHPYMYTHVLLYLHHMIYYIIRDNNHNNICQYSVDSGVKKCRCIHSTQTPFIPPLLYIQAISTSIYVPVKIYGIFPIMPTQWILYWFLPYP